MMHFSTKAIQCTKFVQHDALYCVVVLTADGEGNQDEQLND